MKLLILLLLTSCSLTWDKKIIPGDCYNNTVLTFKVLNILEDDEMQVFIYPNDYFADGKQDVKTNILTRSNYKIVKCPKKKEK